MSRDTDHGAGTETSRRSLLRTVGAGAAVTLATTATGAAASTSSTADGIEGLDGVSPDDCWEDCSCTDTICDVGQVLHYEECQTCCWDGGEVVCGDTTRLCGC